MKSCFILDLVCPSKAHVLKSQLSSGGTREVLETLGTGAHESDERGRWGHASEGDSLLLDDFSLTFCFLATTESVSLLDHLFPP